MRYERRVGGYLKVRVERERERGGEGEALIIENEKMEAKLFMRGN